MYGFMGKILIVDLTSGSSKEVSFDEDFYRMYLGGSFLGAKLFSDQLAQTSVSNPFSPENPLVFATGPFAGENVCGAKRVNIFSLSPETTGTYLSQAGGEFGPTLKRAGFDALVIIGRSASPTYIKIIRRVTSCQCSFEEAKHVWGKDRVETDRILRQELDDRFCIASIGPAGEKLVRCANIMFEFDHYAGRGGLGAVMGSKNLKAICISGDQKPVFGDREKVRAINKNGALRFKQFDSSSFVKILQKMGTFGLVKVNQFNGNLPTRNFKYACIESEKFEKEIDHGNASEKYVGKSNACKACYMACKKQYRKDSPYADYTALSEYESIALLGPNIGLEHDLTYGLKACELCNRLGLDTMSMGNIIAWLMDCFEHDVLNPDETGFSIRFGDGEKACELIQDIALRKTRLGNLLADGIFKAVDVLGEKTRPYLRASRGIGFPAHMPRKKPGIGFGYLHGPNPADHMKLEHDWIASDQGSLKSFGLTISSEPNALDKNTVEIGAVTQTYYSMIDTLSLCLFVFGPGNVYTFDEIVEMVNAATGFNYTFADLMEIGRHSVQLQRKLYYRLGGKDEDFLPYLEVELPNGPSRGNKIKKGDFDKAREHYNTLWE